MNHNSKGMALMATIHCLVGCSIGEVAGMMLGTHYGWDNLTTVVVSISLAFITGYTLSTLPLVRNGIPVRRAMRLVLAADTLSILTMEVVNNGIMLAVPGAMDAHLLSLHFWIPMTISLIIAGMVAYPVNAWLLSRGQGHAITHHAAHGHGEDSMHADHESHAEHGNGDHTGHH